VIVTGHVDGGTVELERATASRMNPRFPIAMWQPRDAQPLLQAAEKAAEAGNYLSAGNLLRDAARLQEANLGPRHPDLANTLNNLGIVCEMTGKLDDAEQYFRRAVSIARTSLPSDDPFVATSQKNLRDFCEARGKEVEVEELSKPREDVQEVVASPEPVPVPDPEPKPEPKATSPAEEPRPSAIEPEPVDLIEPEQVDPIEPEPVDLIEPEQVDPIEPEPEDPEVTSKRFFTRVALGALGPIAMLMVVLAAGLPRLGAPELVVPTSTVTLDSRRNVAPPPTPAPVEPIPAPEETASTPSASSEDAEETASRDAAPSPTPTSSAPAATATPARPVVVRASLCGDLEDWSCDPADSPVPEGPLFFYTQIQSPTVTTIKHRWYQDSRLIQSVELRVQPTRAGYRAYSRNVMKSESAGNWRVEVRSENGTLLHSERFTVR
jgi:DUF2914 family protein/tetratricopeptide repeat protein